MTTILDMLVAALREIGADGVARAVKDGCPWATWTVGEIDALDREQLPVAAASILTARPAFLDDGALVPLPDWLECHGAMCQGRGPHSEEVHVWSHGSDHFELWIGRYATSDAEDDIELVSGDYPTAPAAWRAAEEWLKEQGGAA